MGRLNLTDGARALIFRAIVERLRTNATLQSSGVEHWLAWEDVDGDNKALDELHAPAVRLTPNLGAMAWLFAGTQSGDLVVDIEASLPGMHADDFMNLQDAIEEAFYADDQFTFCRTLQDLGATTGQIEFIKPLSQDSRSVGADEVWRPLSSFKIAINRNLLAG